MGVWHAGAICAAVFCLTALTYFYKRRAACAFFMAVFLASAPWFGYLSLGALNAVLFWTATVLLWGVPVISLIVFLIDYRFAVVTIDTIFAFVVFWALCPIYLAACVLCAVAMAILQRA